MPSPPLGLAPDVAGSPNRFPASTPAAAGEGDVNLATEQAVQPLLEPLAAAAPRLVTEVEIGRKEREHAAEICAPVDDAIAGLRAQRGHSGGPNTSEQQ